jgi:hypothetical protein
MPRMHPRKRDGQILQITCFVYNIRSWHFLKHWE